MHQTRVDQSTTKAHVNVMLDCCVSDATITYRYNVQYLLVTIGMQVEEIVSKYKCMGPADRKIKIGFISKCIRCSEFCTVVK